MPSLFFTDGIQACKTIGYVRLSPGNYYIKFSIINEDQYPENDVPFGASGCFPTVINGHVSSGVAFASTNLAAAYVRGQPYPERIFHRVLHQYDAVLGGVIMAWFSWNWVFFMQAVMGMIAMGGVFWLKEPLQEPENVSISETMGLYLKLFGNRRYIGLVLLFSLA